MSATTTSTARPRERWSPERRRTQILETATRLISESGFNAVTLASVADACNLRRPSVLHYFATMDALLIAVINAHDDDQFAFFQELDRRTSTGSPTEVRALFTAVFQRNIANPELLRLHVMLSVEALSASHPAHQVYKRREEGARATLEQRLTWKRNPHRAAAELTAFWNGLEAVWVRDPGLDVMKVFEAYAERFFASD